MVMSNQISNFVVRQEYYVPEIALEKDRLVRAVRHISLAISCLDNIRTLFFSYEQAPVVGREGGTIGARPCFAVQIPYADLNAYSRHLQAGRVNPQTSHLYSALDSLNLRCTRIFYTKAPEMTMVSLELSEHFTSEELELLRAHRVSAIDGYSTSSEDTDDFYILSNAPSDAGSEPTRKFEVQTTFWAKPHFVDIAQKIAQYICTIDPRKVLYFPVEDEFEILAGQGTLGELPTYMMTREFTESEYRNRLEADLNNPAIIEATKLLAICCKIQTCQFWKHQIN